MKKKGIIILLLLILISSYLYWNYKYVQFYPVKFNTQDYLISEENPSTQFYNNLEKVLNHYGEDFKNEEGVIYIKNKMLRDKELLHNYTKKANDSIWLSNKN